MRHITLVLTLTTLLVGCNLPEREPVEGTESFDQFFGATQTQSEGYREAQNAIRSGEIPSLDDVTVEGALSNYEIRENASDCGQLLCVNSESTVAPSLIEEREVVWVRDRVTSGVASTSRPATDVVIALDTSGLMVDLPQTTAAANAILAELRDGDRFAVITFKDEASVVQPPVDVANADRRAIMDRVAALDSSGRHDVQVGLDASYSVLDQMGNDPNRVRRVVIFTCGYPDGEERSRFYDSTLAGSDARIGTTLVGVLLSYDDAIASRYASIPGANYFAAHDLDALRIFFAEEFAKYAAPIAYDVGYRFGSTTDYSIGAAYGNGNVDGLDFQLTTAYPTTRRGQVIARLQTANPATFLSHTAFDYRPESSRGFSTPVHDVAELDASAEPSTAFQKSIAIVNTAEVMRAALGAKEAGDVTAAREMLNDLAAYLDETAQTLQDDELAAESAAVKKLAGLM